MTPATTEHLTRILLVEDNKIDARLTRQALERLPEWPTVVELMDDGDKAIKHLAAQTQPPHLVILDLNLPKRDGTEVLQFIRGSQDLKHLLVFIFSSSPPDVAEDRIISANLAADSYFEKPAIVGTYFSIAKQFKEQYLRTTALRNGAVA